MATATALLPTNFGGDADFRTWAQGVHAHLAALGLVQAADTGQINLATVARPATTSTAAGYEIWRFADALQATLPVYIKIEYGTFTSVDRPAVWITVGTGTNGAGTINGQAGARQSLGQGNSDAALTTRNVQASGDTGRVSMAFSPAVGANGYAFFVERPKDSAGNRTADGIATVTITGSGSPVCQMIPAIGSVPAIGNASLIPQSGGLSAVGVDIAVAPILCFLGKVLYTWIGTMNSVDITGDATFAAQMFGAAHTFRTHRTTASPGILAFLWE